nr:caspase family protein [uncultured Roseateles sp.]
MLATLLLCAAAPSPAQAQEAPVLVLDVGSHTGPLRRMSTDPGGRLAVTVSDDKTAMLWDLATGRALRTLRVPVGADESGRLYGAAIAPDSRTVALAGTTALAGGVPRIYLFDLPSGNFRSAFKALGANVRHLAWSADGQWLAAAYIGEAALRVFRADGSLAHETRLPADAYGLSISAAGQLAVSAFDGRVRLFNLGANGVQPAGEIAVALSDPVGVRHSPDGRLLAVGYFSRAARDRVRVDVYDAQTGRSVRSIDFRDLYYGNLMNVGWQSDGRALYAGGTGYNDAGRFVVKRISWPEGRSDSTAVASDSIQDFAALPDGRMALASFDATWTLLDGLRPVAQSGSLTTRVANATPLKLSPDATTAEWRSAAGEIRSFALSSRHPGSGEALTRPPTSSSFALRVSDWENTREPKINGNRVELLANESSRAAALLPSGGSVVLATSRALRRLDAQGTPIWTVPLHTEARSVNVSADGKLVVAALADGTLRWRRADDGAALLSLLLLQDGRWVLWTEAGYFDAGPGSEDLVGWLVPRPGGERADYFGVSRFRERYLRPDVIDQVLAQRDPARALQVANAQRVQLAQEQANPEVVKSLQAELAPRPLALSLPPVVTLAPMPTTEVAYVPRVETSLAELAINYKLFAIDKQAIDKLIVRVDGRPVEATFQQTDIGAGGEAEGRMVIALSKHEGKIQIFAEGPNGTSMPAELDFVSTAPSLQPPVDRRPRLYLLAVGVSRYANKDYNLGLAAKDARDFSRALEQQSGVYYQQVETRLLLDEQATRANVLAGLRWLQTVTKPNDMAILFVAGHGVADAADVYHFLPHDMKDTQVAQTGVSETQLRGTLAAIKGRALFFVDTCFAGKSVGKFTRREITRLANGLASSELGVIVFSGSAPRQESLEDTAWGNGAFTKALVAGLSGLADFRKEGVVTHKGLDYYVAHEVRSLTQGRQTPVTAVPNGISDFPLAAVSAPNRK